MRKMGWHWETLEEHRWGVTEQQKSNKNREPDNKQWLKMKEGTNERTEKSTESEGKE